MFQMFLNTCYFRLIVDLIRSDAVTSLLVADAPLDAAVDACAAVVTGHQDGAFRVWHLVYAPLPAAERSRRRRQQRQQRQQDRAATDGSAADGNQEAIDEDDDDEEDDEDEDEDDEDDAEADHADIGDEIGARTSQLARVVEGDVEIETATPEPPTTGATAASASSDTAPVAGSRRDRSMSPANSVDDSPSSTGGSGGSADEPARPGAPPPGAVALETNTARNANPHRFVWHLRLVFERVGMGGTSKGSSDAGGGAAAAAAAVSSASASSSTPTASIANPRTSSSSSVSGSSSASTSSSPTAASVVPTTYRAPASGPSPHRAAVTALALSADRHSLWAADADGRVTAWHCAPAACASRAANGTAPVSFSALAAATRDPALAVPHEPVAGEACAPCAACRKTKYRARERRVFCVACAEWTCAAGECQLEHIRNAHKL